MFAIDTIVKFANPADAVEADERFKILEMRGDRVLVEMTGNAFDTWTIKPTTVYLATDLMEVL